MANNSVPTAQAYLKNSPSGIPGDITRVDETSVEPAIYGSTPPLVFGAPVKWDTNGALIAFDGSETAASFVGVNVREVPSIGGSTTQGLNDATPNTDQIAGLAVRGYISVLCPTGTPVRGGIVYVRVVANAPKAIGDFEATADGSNNVALSATQASWATNGKDANNNAELRIAR